ncbi:MAG: hypothetical protein DDT33_01112 [Firmicutes bacterium]|nr:hypothetical protein [Bacillota bacterium]
MDTKCSVIALVLGNRQEDAPEVQRVLTAHGCLFKVRLGVPWGKVCSNEGLIVLVADDSEEELTAFLTEMKKFPHVKVHQADLS